MHKDELIQLHTLLCQLKHYLERTIEVNGHFKDYESYGVSPQHIHKSKQQHKRAVFLLGKDLADTLGGNDEFSNAHKIGMRFNELAKKGGHKVAVPPAFGTPA